MAELDFLSEHLNGLLQQLSGQQKQKMAMEIARKLRKSQKQRITSQKNPDGSSYRERKRPVKALKPVSFIYQKANGQKRLVELKSYRRTPTRLIGYDTVANGTRTFVKTRIVRYLPNHQSTASDRPTTRNKMFKQIRNAQYLRIKKTMQGAEIGFNPQLSNILNIHQFGLMGEVEKGGKQVKYAKREILGFSPEEKQMIEKEILDYLEFNHFG